MAIVNGKFISGKPQPVKKGIVVKYHKAHIQRAYNVNDLALLRKIARNRMRDGGDLYMSLQRKEGTIYMHETLQCLDALKMYKACDGSPDTIIVSELKAKSLLQIVKSELIRISGKRPSVKD